LPEGEKLSMNKIIIGIIAAVIVLGELGYFFNNSKHVETSKSSVVQVVAAENFYGDIVKQLGGSHVSVVSILSDPNADPHEYESSVQDAEAIAKANIVIENGEGYDTWMDKLLSASPNKNRVVLVASQIADHKLLDNPHVWYGFENVHTIAGKIVDTLKQEDPKDASAFTKNLVAFNNSLQPLEEKIADIKAKYSGTPVALTETIYLYQTQPEGLNVLTPYGFEKAIAEGNDPSADDVATTNDQITSKQAKALIYNVETITPITTNLQKEAKKENMPIIPVSETLPQGKHYQDWMMGQLTDLENALQLIK